MGGNAYKNGIADHPCAAVLLLRAFTFAMEKHAGQTREEPNGRPAIVHPVAVANLLATVGGVSDLTVLIAALLHDTLEDTSALASDLAVRFSREVRDLVAEVTDPPGLPSEERKRHQEAQAPRLSLRAKLLKLADKACNVFDVAHFPGAGWSVERRLAYVEHAERVVAGCRGVNPDLEIYFDRLASEARSKLAGERG